MSNEDTKHLDLLSTLHYFAGAIMAFFSCFPLLHIGWGLATGSRQLFNISLISQPSNEWGWIFVLMESIFFALGLNMAICIMIVGWKLKRRKSRLFCMSVAGMECIFLPFGVLLGGTTLIALNKVSIKEMFAPQPPTIAK